MEKVGNNKLMLISKYERYMGYMIKLIYILPRTEKFSIGNEYKLSMYKSMENILYLNKVAANRLVYVNKIDTELMIQRILLRIMKNEKWISEQKFNVAMKMMYEIGKIVGGLTKYYENNTKYV